MPDRHYVRSMRSAPHLLFICAMMLGAMACHSGKPSEKRGPTEPVKADTTEMKVDTRPGLPLPTGFDIRVFANPKEEGIVGTSVEVDIPEGSYVISALSDRDYLGKFSVSWTDSTIRPASALIESPVSMPGWEPFDKVYTPMLLEPTVITQDWQLPQGEGPFQGEVFFVLEPQCIPYALEFVLEKEEMGWSTSYGLVHPAY